MTTTSEQIERNNSKLFIGIDPDTDKSGVAVYYKKENKLELSNLRFFELFELFNFLKDNITKVIIEAGWLNKKSNWHNDQTNRNISALIGKHVGANHESGRKIVEMCVFLKIPYELRKPLSSKIDSNYFKKITKYNKVTNQEQRDAAMLVVGM